MLHVHVVDQKTKKAAEFLNCYARIIHLN